MAADDSASTDQPFILPRPLQYPASTPPILITQGAEGRLYKTTFLSPDTPCALKYRPPKTYRHAVLDQRLTRQRIVSEARTLVKCQREGVVVPAVLAVDESSGCMMLEWIQGETVRARLNEWLAANPEVDGSKGVQLRALMRRVGNAVGHLHRVGVIHGDLTTSNMMLRPQLDGSLHGETDTGGVLNGDIVIIDFGLAGQGVQDEDRAVDLYVLERAFGSTHPRADAFFNEVLEGYKDAFKQGGVVLKRLNEVRLRGRKRSMLG